MLEKSLVDLFCYTVNICKNLKKKIAKRWKIRENQQFLEEPYYNQFSLFVS